MTVQEIYEKFSDLLNNLQREEVVSFGLQMLEEKQLDIPTLYESVITPALNAIEIPRNLEDQLIWREHVMSGICRNLIERATPYVRQQMLASPKPLIGKKVVILSPEEEYHELGPRMGLDFFSIAGAHVDFVGVNLPLSNIRSAISSLSPDIACISISNPLNVFYINEYIDHARKASAKPLHIALSGSAAFHIGSYSHNLKADSVIHSMEDILALGGESL